MKFFRPGYWQKLILFLVFLIQFLLVLTLLIWLVDYVSGNLYGILYLIGVVFTIDVAIGVYIMNTNVPDVYKLSWMFLVFFLPVGGALMYLFLANKQTSKSQHKKFLAAKRYVQRVPTPEETDATLEKTSRTALGISRYLEARAGAGVHQRTTVKFYSIVDDAFEPILEELRKAKHYIFLEFFIVARGKMWDSMLEILKQKAAEGVDVRFIYDDVGSLTTAPIGYDTQLTAMGVKTICFNRFRPLLDIRMNNRDHRKILVIDGHTCFSGGFNLADEYINAEERFGHWKDNAILIRGEAVVNFTKMFLANWAANKEIDEDEAAIAAGAYEPERYIDEIGGFPESDGFVQPYGDLPYDKDAVGERVYIDLINAAHTSIYMTTPYLIIDKEMENAMIHAAHRGVDVRLLTPHIPDKAAVFNLTRSFYGRLMRAGVRVYEYTPGFVHEKTFICDGRMATVGTINLDYRSLFLHLECGTFMYKCTCIDDMVKDYLETLEKSHEVTMTQWKRWEDRQYWYWAVLRILGPFL
ncbi:MAG: cardiolipin synthase [Bacilli bacterium]|nr:cardiolipin synthase [Bacilli bacterium]